ncbi:MAG: hypothetical protein BGP18_16305 [Stenotrophomonas sp. 69-14]|nr:MAG: hypothetical protein BGP18_16305 [Stenotrophomonas sp. 69-14]
MRGAIWQYRHPVTHLAVIPRKRSGGQGDSRLPYLQCDTGIPGNRRHRPEMSCKYRLARTHVAQQALAWRHRIRCLRRDDPIAAVHGDIDAPD